ncbi:MAG: HIT family protein, partial [Sedimentisphaerales bacterium]|nr:HIT family protein [Sedimentisphaerales bacterium]
IFCKIARGEIPCAGIFEDDQVLAFLDINPWSEGHSLIIPKAHFVHLHECPVEVISTLARQIGPIAEAIIKAVGAEGYNLLNNNGRSAGQLVEHVHFHIIPRKTGDGIIRHAPQNTYPPGRMDEIAARIANELK